MLLATKACAHHRTHMPDLALSDKHCSRHERHLRINLRSSIPNSNTFGLDCQLEYEAQELARMHGPIINNISSDCRGPSFVLLASYTRTNLRIQSASQVPTRLKDDTGHDTGLGEKKIDCTCSMEPGYSALLVAKPSTEDKNWCETYVPLAWVYVTPRDLDPPVLGKEPGMLNTCVVWGSVPDSFAPSRRLRHHGAVALSHCPPSRWLLNSFAPSWRLHHHGGVALSQCPPSRWLKLWCHHGKLSVAQVPSRHSHSECSITAHSDVPSRHVYPPLTLHVRHAELASKALGISEERSACAL